MRGGLDQGIHENIEIFSATLLKASVLEDVLSLQDSSVMKQVLLGLYNGRFLFEDMSR